MATTAKVHTDGADIVYDYEGTGPLLLLIVGGGGDAPRYTGISAILKDQYTVVRYDRRCCSRSTGDADQNLDVGQQARDAVAIIKAMGADTAFIFGNSGGGAIAVKIAEDHPEMVRGMIVHEPSILKVLPDADQIMQFIDKVEAVYHDKGTGPAMGLFATSLKGFEGASNAPGHRIGDRQSDGNLDFFMAREFHNLSRYSPDMERIRRNNVPMIAVAGDLSADAYYARTAQVLADAVDCPHRMMSGHHIAFVPHPAIFAAELRELLDEVKATAAA